MHDFQFDKTRQVYLSALKDGDVFVANSGHGHGHQTGIVFSGRGVLILTGPERFTAFRFDAHDNTPVALCPEWRDMRIRVPAGLDVAQRETPKLGRIVFDEEGMHLTIRWRETEGNPGSFSAVLLGIWNHGSVPAGFDFDAWSIVRPDARGGEAVLVALTAKPAPGSDCGWL